MREGWTKRKLGDVITLEYGKPLPNDQRREDKGFPAYGANGIKCFAAKPYCNDPSVIVGRKGTAGAVNLVDGGFWPLDVTYYLAFEKEKHDLKFLYYMLSVLDLPSLATGVKPGINRNLVYAIEQYFPPRPEQKRIVAILDEAFAGIATAVANTERNLANARELFESYLNSVISQRAEGWVVRTFNDICSIPSKLVDPRDLEFNEMRHVGAGNIVSMTGELIGVQTAKEEGLKSGKFLFDQTMVLYSKIRPYLMKVARPDFSGLCSADIYPLAPETGLLDRGFLYYLLLSKHFTDFAVAGSARVGMPKVNREHLFSYTTAMPGVEQQKSLVEGLDSVANESKRLESICRQKLNALTDLKQSLLQKAFSGELTTAPQDEIETALA